MAATSATIKKTYTTDTSVVLLILELSQSLSLSNNPNDLRRMTAPSLWFNHTLPFKRSQHNVHRRIPSDETRNAVVDHMNHCGGRRPDLAFTAS